MTAREMTQALLLMLTAVTGVVDAVSILSLGRVFVANMTGNVVFAGFAAVGAPGFSLSASLFALAGFLVGAAVGGLMITRSGGDGKRLLRAGVAAELVLAAVSLVLAAASGAPGVSRGTMAISGAPFGFAVTSALAALLAVALGIQNAVARKLAVPDLTTTVLTMTLTGLGADLRAVLRGAGGPDGGAAHAKAKAALARRLLAVAMMLRAPSPPRCSCCTSARSRRWRWRSPCSRSPPPAPPRSPAAASPRPRRRCR
jgi:uncharacterized membrane protein YoaK (UPF0700 family)